MGNLGRGSFEGVVGEPMSFEGFLAASLFCSTCAAAPVFQTKTLHSADPQPKKPQCDSELSFVSGLS